MRKLLNDILDMKAFPPAERIESALSFLTNEQQILAACRFVRNTPLRGGGTVAGLLPSGGCRSVIEAARSFALGETSKKDALKIYAEAALREWGSAEEHAEYERKRPDNEARANRMLAYANACHAAIMSYGWHENPGTTTPRIARLAAEYAAIAVAYASWTKTAPERDLVRDETLEAQAEMLRAFIQALEDGKDEDI